MKIKKYIEIETRADGTVYYYGHIKYDVKFLFFKIPVRLNLINSAFKGEYELDKCQGDKFYSYSDCAESLYIAVKKFEDRIQRNTIKNIETRKLM